MSKFVDRLLIFDYWAFLSGSYSMLTSYRLPSLLLQ